MKLKIKNFGPLTKGGTIDLDKRFYVFVGKNGSGKTYLANLMYALLGQGYNYSILGELAKKYTGTRKFDDSQSITIDSKDCSFGGTTLNSLLKPIFGQSNSSLLKKSELVLSFSYEKDFINKEMRILLTNKTQNELYFYNKEKGSNIITYRIEKEIEKKQILDPQLSYGLGDNLRLDAANQIIFNYSLSEWLLTEGNMGRNILLPANRSSFLSLWRYIASIERKEKDTLFDFNSNGKLLSETELKNFQPLYTKPVNDLIDQLESFDAQSSSPKNHYSDLVEELEVLMGGKIKVHEPKEGIGRKRFTFEMAGNGEELELFLASSAVNQLSTLYIYLKYWAEEKRNFLIIDEPEINLHPENQIKLVNILMKFADRNDNRVLITTHSTLLTDVINNHVRIGYLQTKGEKQVEWLKNHQLDINENITYKDFGVYHFTGNAIEEYPVGDYGVAFKDFNKVIKKVEGVEDELKDQIYNSLRQEEN